MMQSDDTASAAPPIRLILVDDHQIVRTGLRMLFASEPDIEIVGEGDSGAAAIDLAQRVHPDVVVMDVAMPGMSGIEATRHIKEVAPNVAVLALTMYEDEEYFFQMIDAGASGYVPKRAAPDDLLAAIRVVAQGNVFLHATLARFLTRDTTRAATEALADDNLTAREWEVLKLIAEGLTSREIAARLVISPKTVDRHRENIMAKLNLHNRAELVRFAVARGLLPP
jgi:two-component system response regulator NreC